MDENIVQKVDEFFRQFPKRSYPKGQILIFGGENPEHIYYLTKGAVRQHDVSYRGDEVIVNMFKPPAFFPMSWAINGTPNKYFYKTEQAVELHVAPVEETLQFVKDNPDVLLDLVSRLYKGIDGLLGRLVHLMSGSARSRLLYELITECRRFGQKQSEGFLISATEVDLAARSGLSRETVSREINKMKSDGLLSVDSKGILIKVPDLLEQKLGQEI